MPKRRVFDIVKYCGILMKDDNLSFQQAVGKIEGMKWPLIIEGLTVEEASEEGYGVHTSWMTEVEVIE